MTNRTWIRFLPSFLKTHVEGSQPLQRSITNSSWLFFDQVTRIGGGFLIGIWIARYLGPAQLGLLNYSIAFVSLFSALSSLGLSGIVVRELVKEPGKREEILASAFVMLVLSGVMTFLFTLATIFFLRPADLQIQLLVAVIAFGMILFQSFTVIEYWFASQVQSKFTVYARDASFLVLALVKIALLLGNAPLIAFALALMTEMIFSALLLLVIYKAKGFSLRFGRAKKSRCKQLLRDSWPAAITTVFVTLLLKTDIIMLGEMVGNESVGIYSVATTISIFWHFLPIIIVSSVGPFIIQAKADNEEIYIRRITQLFNLMTALALPIIVVIAVFADTLIDFLYGKLYAAAGPVLAIHIIGCWVEFLAHAQGLWDIAENLLRFHMFRSIAAVLINILLNLLLIPHYEAIGAAVASVISYFIAGILLNLASKKTRPIFFLQVKSLFFVRYLK